jgi:hypothetical protein
VSLFNYFPGFVPHVQKELEGAWAQKALRQGQGHGQGNGQGLDLYTPADPCNQEKLLFRALSAIRHPC